MTSALQLKTKISGSAIGSLRTIEKEFWDWRLRDSPEFASVAGVNKYNDRMTSYSLAAFQNRHVRVTIRNVGTILANRSYFFINNITTM